MSEQVLLRKYRRRRYRSAVDRLLEDPYDEDAWYEVFGDLLETHVCTLVVIEEFVEACGCGESWRYYRRRALGYAERWVP